MSTVLHRCLRWLSVARFWCLASAALALGVLLHGLGTAGVLPGGFVADHGLPIGAALAGGLLAFGLADRRHRRTVKRLLGQRSALEAKARLNHDFEVELIDCMRALEATKQQLAAISITDELTGARNRGHFDEVLDHELRRRARGGRAFLALALLDVDHFGAYNDRHGHAQGDRALITVSAVVRGLLRRSTDHCFRIAGDQFALVFLADHAQPAIEFVDLLRETIVRLKMPHDGSPHQRLSVSVGIVLLPGDMPSPTASSLHAQADALLSAAKVSGRNKVCSEVLKATPATQAAA
jgi:diguanylate cyclase (GGDEF)-like protein